MYWRCGAGFLNCWWRSSWLGRRVCGRWSFGKCWINAERFAGAINAAKGWIAGIRLSELRIVQVSKGSRHCLVWFRCVFLCVLMERTFGISRACEFWIGAGFAWPSRG